MVAGDRRVAPNECQSSGLVGLVSSCYRLGLREIDTGARSKSAESMPFLSILVIPIDIDSTELRKVSTIVELSARRVLLVTHYC